MWIWMSFPQNNEKHYRCPLISFLIWHAVLWKLQKPLNLWFTAPRHSSLRDRHQSVVNVFQREFMSTAVPLSSCLLLNPLEDSPSKGSPERLASEPHTNERHYTLQSVWFKDDLQSFPSALSNGKRPRDKPRIHLQNSKGHQSFQIVYRIHRRV